MRIDIGQQLTMRRAAILTLIGLAPSACSQGDVERVDDTATAGAGDTSGPSSGSSSGTSTPPIAEVAPEPAPCGSSVPKEGSPGYAICDNGVTHRVTAVDVENHIPELDAPNPDSLIIQPEVLGCTQHGDCTEHEYGYCRPVGVPIQGDLQCAYGCTTDSECGDGSLCHEGYPAGTCAPAGCRTDADCGEGLLCVEVYDHGGCGAPPEFTCQRPDDPCVKDTDCAASGQWCIVVDDRLQCTPSQAVCGRPFIVEAHARVAALVDDDGWRGGVKVAGLGLLSKRDQEALGAAWTKVALMEHGSIAAFARFTLQLLQLGAPAELVAASNQALLDETHHAQLAFGLAEAYLGRALGPGPLEVEHCLGASTLCEVLRLVVQEGCIGETVAAFEARYALAHCRVAEVRGVLERIAQDESRHSDLAWRFVHWALEIEPELIEVVIAECAAAAAELTAACVAVSDEMGDAVSNQSAPYQDAKWLEHGVVLPRESERLRRLVIEQIVLPCAAALSSRRAAA